MLTGCVQMNKIFQYYENLPIGRILLALFLVYLPFNQRIWFSAVHSPHLVQGLPKHDGKSLVGLVPSEDALSNNSKGGILHLALELLFSNFCLLEGALSTHA